MITTHINITKVHIGLKGKKKVVIILPFFGQWDLTSQGLAHKEHHPNKP